MSTAPESWPFTMPDPDADATLGPSRGPRAEAAKLLGGADAELVALRPTLSDAALSATVRGLASQAVSTVAEFRRHIHASAATLDALAENDLVPEAGLRRLVQEANEKAGAALHDVDERAKVQIGVLDAALTNAAQPTFPADADRAEARDELKMLLDASSDPAATVRELVAGDDQRLAALAASSFAASYLRSRGVPDDVVRATRTFAAQAATRSTDPTRAAAGRALLQLDRLRKAAVASRTAAHFAIGWDG